jgi:predicted nuclease of predicted toxin-antitoxin system
MAGFLFDANFSPKIAVFLRSELGLDAIHVADIGLLGHSDVDIVTYARAHERAVVTFDLDYGDLFFRPDQEPFGAIILRIPNQRRHVVEELLRRFFGSDVDHEELTRSLVVLDHKRYRIVPAPLRRALPE